MPTLGELLRARQPVTIDTGPAESARSTGPVTVVSGSADPLPVTEWAVLPGYRAPLAVALGRRALPWEAPVPVALFCPHLAEHKPVSTCPAPDPLAELEARALYGDR